jgi:hypothetical protein
VLATAFSPKLADGDVDENGKNSAKFPSSKGLVFVYKWAIIIARKVPRG